MKKLFLFIVCLFTFLVSGNAQSIFGKWKTIDDDTGEAKSIVEIYELDGKAYAKVVEILEKENEDKTIASNEPYVSKTKELGWKDVLVKGAEKITGKEVAFVEDLPNDDEKRWSLNIGRFGIERVKD